MKLVEILARELKEWPDGAIDITQGRSGLLYDQQSDIVGRIEYIAENQDYACVTRAQWEAERVHIAANQQAEVGSREFAEQCWEASKGEVGCAGRSKEDQELRDNVALDFLKKNSSPGASKSMIKHESEQAWLYAEAFMAERAKRMKG